MKHNNNIHTFLHCSRSKHVAIVSLYYRTINIFSKFKLLFINVLNFKKRIQYLFILNVWKILLSSNFRITSPFTELICQYIKQKVVNRNILFILPHNWFWWPPIKLKSDDGSICIYFICGVTNADRFLKSNVLYVVRVSLDLESWKAALLL